MALQRIDQYRVIYRDNDNVLIDLLLDRLKDGPAFGVIGRVVANQYQNAIDLLTRLPEGFNHPNRVLPSVEPGDLYHQRPVYWNLMASQSLSNFRIGQVGILWRERIDCGRDESLVDSEILPVFRKREDRRIVAIDEIS